MSVRNKNEMTKLLGQLSDIKAGGFSVTKLATGSQFGANPTRRSLLKPQSQSASGLTGYGTDDRVTGAIRFGAPSYSSSPSTNGTSELGNLIKQSSSGGFSSILGGGVLGTLGSLFSHVAGWFGGSQVPKEPLIPFRLPDSQTQEFSLTSATAGISNNSSQSGGLYSPVNNATMPINPVDQGSDLQSQRAQIVETVRLALLNSSSLNDVIGEM
jgi:hypothetical protein